MAIEFLIDETKKDLERLNKIIKEAGIVKKQDDKSRFMKSLMVEAIRSRHHQHHVEKHLSQQSFFRPLENANRDISYFKPHDIMRLQKIPAKMTEGVRHGEEYNLVKTGNLVIVSAVIDNNVYKIIEPGLTEIDLKVIEELKKSNIVDDDMLKFKLGMLSKIAGASISNDYFEKIKYYLTRDNRLGKIGMMIKDDRVKRISCNGVGHRVIVNVNGKDFVTDIAYINREELNNTVGRIAEILHEKLSEFEPILEGIMENGMRVQAVMGTNIVSPRFIITR